MGTSAGAMISTWSRQFLTLVEWARNAPILLGSSRWSGSRFPSVLLGGAGGVRSPPRRSRSFRLAVCAEFGKVGILVNSAGITRRTPILRHKRQRLECDAGDQPEGHTSVRILDAT